MKLSALLGRPCAPDPEIAGLALDSRAVRPGYLFAALEGAKDDGARYVPQAEENGAVAVLAGRRIETKAALVVDPDPRRLLAQMAARFYPRQPGIVAGVTGTNGKTSTARFSAQLWTMLGGKGASLGTLGAFAPGYEKKLAHTTPDAATLHETLDEMAGLGVTHLTMEASSHALVQRRADGVRFAIAAFTNITQDHLDYHPDFESYLAAKARLFTELLPQDGVAVVNADGEGAPLILERARTAGRRVMTTGALGKDLRITRARPHPAGLSIDVVCGEKTFALDLPLIGAFQAENALLAAGIVIASGFAADAVLPLLPRLDGVPGRMQRVGGVAGAAIYIDYAHTPDAIATALAAIRPHVKGRLVAIIGAGGDRDRAKRPHMGRAAALGADVVIVADDNPRSEDPAEIRRQILAGAPKAIEIGDRREAIARAVAMLESGDVLLIAGKGHETGQIVGDVVHPFDDGAVARAEAAKRVREGS
ncbi:UDP-N-acetylmuramoyl-L-alanyl-D-glutamate--2,6-diaminopimelate ligase [Amphiplicatus metriothermophilus]|uniref:UDP-N-acetylmuramoyl-L-alanyl-D-glutamate--2,6-diaminopimelate ligase n=1 Tax=Amphiplicatus metriothermophilus TaxID=1519374 RepID=A0A239PUE8_9PROT|nr:UDP-N-acetylmuramoyl-L-alanyl-D-glutamate--2,6-diaminopimelate ligase [Amphiplicatus metriothermophilus]MBB5519248.1 UDP-N-acetylmuramoyl-L-alanyl-D-glutamate--2,6-diaminopimelate ligase [Amphiplicatus metriothermophilus]SNT73317.1 UDP-N-acetylmuramoylalanyl-D-glutamate--2,6-diaminopimelate ligase [Amphiplicatus metriothermophilus]